jgi:menaquinone-dependent protoporphyrinogen oxidase
MKEARKILVAYDTANGSTAEVAARIGREIGASGPQVKVERITEGLDVSGWDAIIIGSPILYGHWTGPAMSFIEKNPGYLAAHPCAIFITCLAQRWGIGNREATRERYVTPVLKKFTYLNPVADAVFAGVIDFSLYDEKVGREMRQTMGYFKGPVEGRHDCRDWEEISGWAKAAGALLSK